MDNKGIERNEGVEIDIQRVLGAVWSKLWVVILSAIMATVITVLGTVFLITPKYEASAMFYVNNNSLSLSDASFSISSSDITASKSLVDSYIVILQTRESLNDVIDYAGVDLTYSELTKMISAEAVNATEFFEVVVTSPDPEEAEKVAKAIAYILPKRISSIIEGTSAKIVDPAVIPVKPSSPNYLVNTVVGFLVGVALSVSIIVLYEIFDITIRTEDDISADSKHPILAAVPDMTAPSKGNYYYYGKNQKKTKKPGPHKKQTELVGPDISFAAAEAYKLLRTKLQFSFSGDTSCRIIGVSSALSGEGKSLSAVNLAYTLSQLGSRVLLIDCDMRRPTISTKLPVAKTPGLSNYLAGQTSMEAIFQNCGIPGEETAFSVVSAGRNPPNPVELLSSTRMTKMLETLRGAYDYILLDLPPIGEVSDALAVAKETDGVLFVVRQNYCNRVVYNAAVRQFEFVGARILGVIYNCASDSRTNYGKKYGKKYGMKYEKGIYEATGVPKKKPAASKSAETET